MLKQHGLVDEAKSLFIEIVHSDADDADKATCLYNLGAIAFNEKRLQVAFDTWKNLVEQYPASDEGKVVVERIDYLASEITELSNDIVDDEIARSYLEHAEFWSGNVKSNRWLIDTSKLDNIELACDWYDKVISEFSGTSAAKLAYVEKFKTILAQWRGKYKSYGVAESLEKYLRPLLSTYDDFVKAFPNSELIPVLRIQIAQVCWGSSYNYQLDDTQRREIKAAAKTWLSLVIGQGDPDSFYTKLAVARLNQINSRK